MTARELALKLAALTESEREKLLGELPEIKQEQLRGLIDELQPILAGRDTSFEALFANLQQENYFSGENKSNRLANRDQLVQLFDGEDLSVKRQLIDVFVHDKDLLAPRVKEIIAAHLQERADRRPSIPRVSGKENAGWLRSLLVRWQKRNMDARR